MKSDRRTFLKQASMAAVGSLVWQSCAPSSRLPNILFITTDYMRGEEIPSDPFSWRSCLGPEETVNQHRANYIKQYQQLLEYDETKRSGRVGRHMKTFLESQNISLGS